MNKVIVWGAGREGRGFFADIFSDAGWYVVFAENNASLCSRLEERKQYTLWQCSAQGGVKPKIVSGYSVINPEQEYEAGKAAEEIAEAKILALCVYPNQYERVVRILDCIISGMDCRLRDNMCEKDILLGVNETDAEKHFLHLAQSMMCSESWEWFHKHIGVVPCIVRRTCTVPEDAYFIRDPLGLMTNSYPELVLDKTKMKTEIGNVQGIQYIADLNRELTMKLYTYNLLHAIYAYGGARKGYHTLWEARMDPDIHRRAEAAVSLSCRALAMEYGISENEMTCYKKNMWSYGICEELGDTIERLAVDPIRKLSCKDRIVGPILLCKKHKLNPYPLYETLVDALCYLDAQNHKGETI